MTQLVGELRRELEEVRQLVKKHEARIEHLESRLDQTQPEVQDAISE